MAQPAPFETLGVFYLGRVYDADRGAATDELVLYDSRDLTTHGVLDAFLGRKRVSARGVGRATTAARGMGRAAREKADIARARERVEELRAQLAELEGEFQAEVQRSETMDPSELEIQEKHVRPRKSDVAVRRVALLWKKTS